MNTTTATALIIAFVAVVLLFAVFGGGALTGHMENGGGEGTGWMWSPALVAFGFGALLFWVIIKKDLLQLAWEKDQNHGLSRRSPRRLHAGTEAGNPLPAVIGIPQLPSN